MPRGRAERDDRRRAPHEQHFREPSSPFFKSLRVLEVGELPRATFQQFLDKRFTAGRRRVSVEACDHVFELAERNPSDVQQLCAALWDVTDVGGGFMPEQVQRALTYVLFTERKGYEAQVRRLTANQVRCLRALARLGGRRPQSQAFVAETGIALPASVKRALTGLVRSQLVYGSELDYKFFDPFFKQWVLREL